MANSRIGAQSLTFAKILNDPAGGTTTYDVPVAIAKKLVSIGIKNSSSMEPQYADDQAVDVYTEDGDIGIDLNVTDFTEDEKAYLLGQTMVAGVRTPNPVTDVRPYFCAMWKSKKRNGKFKWYKILKVMFKEPDEDFETKKEKSTPQLDKISGTGIQRISDGLRKRVADEDSVTWLDATGTNWFAAGDLTVDVAAPTVAVVPADAAIAVAVGASVVWTFNEAIQSALVTAANFFVMTAAGVVKAGALSINAAGTIVTFVPTAAFAAATVYLATVTTNVKDMSGNSLAAQSTTKFTTA